MVYRVTIEIEKDDNLPWTSAGTSYQALIDAWLLRSEQPAIKAAWKEDNLWKGRFSVDFPDRGMAQQFISLTATGAYNDVDSAKELLSQHVNLREKISGGYV